MANIQRQKKQGGRASGFRERPEFEQKVIDVRRVARVVAGGRRFRFRVSLVIGDQKGRVGFGIGKAGDTALAIEKAFHQAKKHLMKIHLNKDGSISSPIGLKKGSVKILIRPAPKGHGLVAGGAVRYVLSLAGVKNVSAKIISRSKNKINQAQATIEALKKLSGQNADS